MIWSWKFLATFIFLLQYLEKVPRTQSLDPDDITTLSTSTYHQVWSAHDYNSNTNNSILDVNSNNRNTSTFISVAGQLIKRDGDNFKNPYVGGNSIDMDYSATALSNNLKAPPNNIRRILRHYDHVTDESLMEIGNKVTDAQVYCDLAANVMTVEFIFNKAFSGYVYTKGYYKTRECKLAGEGINNVRFTFPLDGCGTTIRSQGSFGSSKVWYHNTVIIMYETYLGILESYDRSFELRCELDDKIKKVTAHVTVPMLASKSIGFKLEMPNIWMKLVSGKDPSAPPAPFLTIGEIGTMVIIMENQSNRYDFYAFQCSAHDGSGKSQVILLNDIGCPIHRKLVGPQQFDKLRSQEMISYAHFKVFKFPDIENVYIECYVKLCFHRCPKEKCWIIKNSVRRSKRSSALDNSTVQFFNRTLTTLSNHTAEFKTYQSVSVVFPDTPRNSLHHLDKISRNGRNKSAIDRKSSNSSNRHYAFSNGTANTSRKRYNPTYPRNFKRPSLLKPPAKSRKICVAFGPLLTFVIFQTLILLITVCGSVYMILKCRLYKYVKSFNLLHAYNNSRCSSNNSSNSILAELEKYHRKHPLSMNFKYGYSSDHKTPVKDAAKN